MSVAKLCHAFGVRLLCDSCGEIGPLALAARNLGPEAKAQVQCEHCGAIAQVPVREPAGRGAGLARAGDSPGDSPGDSAGNKAGDAASVGAEVEVARHCPKCHAAYGQRAACPGCGLAAERMAGFSAAQEAELSDTLRASWSAVLERWDDQARHDAFVQAATAAGAFAWAAGKYQDARRSRPGDALAERQMARVRRTAEAAMLASAAVRQVERAPYRGATAVLIMLVVALGAGAMYTAFLRGSRGSPSSDAGRAPSPAQSERGPRGR